jgi:hypothetical protein
MTKQARTNHSESIRDMEKGDALFVKGANARSIQTLCTQIAGEFSPRTYFTKQRDGGIYIWRVE